MRACSVILSLLIKSVFCDDLIRQTTNGPVEGKRRVSALTQEYFSFRGIPYAEPPITGVDPYTKAKVDRRFKAPQPLKRTWTKPLKAYEFGKNCTSNYGNDQTSSEDCLFINVHVPVKGHSVKTVLVVIHGGNFVSGDGNDRIYGPDFLLSGDNIVVTFNYRVGIMGFLNLYTDDYAGNMGLKDQRLALKWVYENIENFSGIKDQIVIMGDDAGGLSVIYQLLNEESRQYFHRAISISATQYPLLRIRHTNRLMMYTKLHTMKELIEYVKTTDARILHGIPPLIPLPPKHMLDRTSWFPIIEFDKKGAMITDHTENIYNSDKAPVKDVLFTFNSKEHFKFYTDLTKVDEPFIPQNLNTSTLLLPFYGFEKRFWPDGYKHAMAILRDAYFGGKVSSYKSTNIDLFSDLNFGYHILKSLRFQVEANNKDGDRNNHRNTYLLKFSANTDQNRFRSIWNQGHYFGATHGDDVCFIFHCNYLAKRGWYFHHLGSNKSESYKVIKRFTGIITAFAQGLPNIENGVPFESCRSANDIVAHELTEHEHLNIIRNITNEMHLDEWNLIDTIHKNLPECIVPMEFSVMYAIKSLQIALG